MATVIISGPGIEITYTGLPPETALVNAFEQDRGNWSWWNYPPVDHYPLRSRNGALSLGAFSIKEVR